MSERLSVVDTARTVAARFGSVDGVITGIDHIVLCVA